MSTIHDGTEEAAERPSLLAFVSSGPTVGPTPWFVHDRTAPRRRRPTDIIRLIVGTAAFGLLAWSARTDADIDVRVLDGIGQLPGWIRSIAWFVYSASGLLAVVVAVGSLFTGVGRGIARDMAIALSIALGLGLTAARLSSGEWPHLLPEFNDRTGIPTFPTLRVTLVVSVALIVGPYVNLGLRRLLNRASIAVVLAPLLLGLTTITSLFGALMLTLGSVAAVRLAFGTPEGLPSIERLSATLAVVGVDATDLHYHSEQPGTVGLATARRVEDGARLDIKIYGKDAASGQRAERVWNALWYRRAGPSPSAGRVEQAQHEALALLTAANAGVTVPRLIGAGMTPDGDVLLVSSGADGEPFAARATLDRSRSTSTDQPAEPARGPSEADEAVADEAMVNKAVVDDAAADEVVVAEQVVVGSEGPDAGERLGAETSDDELDAMWSALAALHGRARITHGSLRAETITFLATDDAHDGTTSGSVTVELSDFDHASMFPTEQQLATDVVTMLAIQATRVGADRAVAAATRVMNVDDLEICLPYVQDAVVEPGLRAELKRSGRSLKSLRSVLAEAIGIEPPDLATVRRIRIQDVVIAVAAIFAANSLITQIADVGLDTLSDELAAASLGWLVVTLLIRLISYTTNYIGMRALIDQELPLLPTTLLQSAKSFVGLVVPSMVGRVGMDIRFLQNLGVPLAVATTQGPIISLIGFVAEVLLLVLSAWAIGQAMDTDDLMSFDAGGLIALAVLVVVVGGLVLAAVPKLRNKVVPVIKDALSSIRTIATSPRILASIFASETLDRLMGALALGATVAAFGADVSFAALIFVSVGTGLLAGLAPVPGGIGVAEATMTGLLTAVGLPPEQAVAIAIVYRMVTSYLPPVFGFFSFRWLTGQGYL